MNEEQKRMAKALLQGKAASKSSPGEHDIIVGTQGSKFILMRTSEWLESGEFQENLEYIGDGRPTEGQKIAAQHPNCHFLILFEGGALAVFTT